MSRKLAWTVIGAALFYAGYVVAQQKPAPEVRRVVTKLDEAGKAVVMFDERVPMSGVRPPNYVANMWVTDKSLPDFSWTTDRAKTQTRLTPPKSGTVFRIVDFVPEPDAVARMDMNTMMQFFVASHTPPTTLPPPHPLIQSTRQSTLH